VKFLSPGVTPFVWKASQQKSGDANRIFVLLHAFEKRSQKLSQKKIWIAMERMNADRKSKEG